MREERGGDRRKDGGGGRGGGRGREKKVGLVGGWRCGIGWFGVGVGEGGKWDRDRREEEGEGGEWRKIGLGGEGGVWGAILDILLTIIII